MEKININLLPEEFLLEKKLGTKKALFLRISIIIFILAMILTSVVLLIRLTQSQTIAGLETELESSKNGVTSLKENESSVFVLKNRLDKIKQISAKESVPVQAYNLVTTIMPSGASIVSFSMVKENMISLNVITSNTTVLDQLFTNLLDPKSNQGYITTVKLENIRLTDQSIAAEMSLAYNPKAAPK